MPTTSKTFYANAFVCEEGHYQHEPYNTVGPNNITCPECGTKVLAKCPHCGAEMIVTTTKTRSSDGKAITVIVNSYCNKCAKPYPWTQRALYCAAYVLNADLQLTEEQKQEVIQVLPDILKERPGTNKSVLVIKKAMSIAGKEAVAGLTRFVMDYGCQYAKELFHSFVQR